MLSPCLPSAIVDGKIIDDVNFKISVNNLDGVGGTLARTKVDFMRYGTLLPAQSITQFDVNDIAELEQSGQLFSVVQHEILHGLGFGNLWEAKGLVDYAGTPLAQYNGENAVAAFQDVGGLTDAIPLETEGEGSAGLHWHEQFQDELMTADLGFQTGEEGQVFSPISAVTLAALADLGYRVNLDKSTPGWGLLGGQQFNPDNLTKEQIKAFRKLTEESFAQPDDEFIYAIMPEVDPAKVSPEIWAHAERFWKNGEYYDWERYQIKSGDTISEIAQWRMGNGVDPDYWWFIANRNGIPNPNYIVTGDWIDIPVHRPNYEWEQEQERKRREEELRKKQEEEARKRREEEERLAREKAEQERKRREEEERRKEAEAKQRELEEQERRLREEQERKRQQEEYEREQARLRELERQREIARQKGKGGQDWFFATRLPEFGPTDPFETSLTGETVGNLVPDDYYRFNLSRKGRVTAELRQLLADADLVLYDVRNNPIAWSMRDGITDEHIIADLIPGTYMLRVNSPKGVTTDYDLIVKFQHLLSMTQQGPPPGWRVGGGNGNGGNPKTPLHANPTESNPLQGFLHPLHTSLGNYEFRKLSSIGKRETIESIDNKINQKKDLIKKEQIEINQQKNNLALTEKRLITLKKFVGTLGWAVLQKTIKIDAYIYLLRKEINERQLNLDKQRKKLEDLEKYATIHNLAGKSSLLTTDEIREYRKIVAQIPESERSQYYRKLQEKTPYFNQRNNNSPGVSGDVMCNLTVLANCLTYLGVENPEPSMQFEDYFEKIREENNYGHREHWTTFVKLACHFDAEPIDNIGHGTTSGSFNAEEIKKAINDGAAVMGSVFVNGLAHIVRYQGYDDFGLIVDDPYGKATDGGVSDYKTKNTTVGDNEDQPGSNNKWSWDFAQKYGRWFLVIKQGAILSQNPEPKDRIQMCDRV